LKLVLTDRTMWMVALAVTVLSVLSSLLLPETPVAFAFMIPFIFFLPGYAMTRLFFSRGLEMDMFILTSMGLSVVSTVLIAMILSITPIGMSQLTVLIAISGLTFIGFIADTWLHRENRRFEIDIAMPKKEDVDPVIAVSIAFGLVLIGIFSYIIFTTHPPTDTMINLLSENGDIRLPNNATVGSDVNFTVVMKNGEGRGAEFKLMVYNNSALYNGTESADNSYTVTLEDDETVERDFSLAFSEAGEQDIEARVFIDGEFYGELHFHVDIL